MPEETGAAATEIPPERLRQAAEEVRPAFPRPIHGPELVLIDVDPSHVHAFWSLPPGVVEEARRELRKAGAGTAPLVLRMSDVPGGGSAGRPVDTEVVGLQGQCYVDIWDEPRRYRGEIGLLQPDGGLLVLARSEPVELPPASPAEATARAAAGEALPAAAPAAEAGGKDSPAVVPAPAAGEPVAHPFPLPPTDPTEFAPELLVAAAPAEVPPAPPADLPRASTPQSPHVGAPAAPDAGGTGPQTPPAAEPAVPDAAFRGAGPHELPEPVRHPFPMPPEEASSFDPFALIGGFLPSEATSSQAEAPQPTGEQGAAAAAPPPGQAAPTGEDVPAGETPSGDAPPAAAAAPQTPPEFGPLPLEHVLTLSSFALGQKSVDFEINAELRVFGRVRPGSELTLFGRKVPLRPDGSFSIVRPLPNGALVLSALLVNGDGDDYPGT